MSAENIGQPLMQVQSHPQASYDYNALPEQREPRKNYVFIDEQNRHKRLKVVKACDGCRKRKIKCDAANTNTWPCGACVRLKMNCVPPAPGPEQNDIFNLEPEPFDTYHYQPHMAGYMQQSSPYDDYFYAQHVGAGYDPSQSLSRTSSHEVPISQPHMHAQSNVIGPASFPAASPAGVGRADSSDVPLAPTVSKSRTESTSSMCQMSEDVLATHLGDLRISGVGHAPYLINNKSLAEQPAMQEEEIDLPKATGPGSHVRIPDEMMPTNAKANEYFRYFFNNVHPYVPVLYPPFHFRHWNENKNSISPLILESVFAISSRMMGEHDESRRWLALARKHEESFKDTPRLSTLQGLLLLLKARETSPTQGYYYRSWMNIVTMVAMAKDLRLHEHFEDHQDGNACDSHKIECLVKTRVWNTLYVVELIVGGPQGRLDFGCTTDTIDFKNTFPILDPIDPEYIISQQFSYLVSAIRMVRDTIRIYAQSRKKKKDWAIDTAYMDHNTRYDRWLDDLPEYLQVQYPKDGSAPHVPSHFTANLHAYFNLCIIMHHRPQLYAFEDAMGETWRTTMTICYAAAKRLCRLQEAISMDFGTPGFLCMQRGINLVIYGVLTCTMLHLVAITHPNPEIHDGAEEYFTRHMRILESCASAWPMPEMEKQILALREAFSADVTKPFELKADFARRPYSPDHSATLPTQFATTTPPLEVSVQSQHSNSYLNHPSVTSAPFLDAGDYPTPDSTSLNMGGMEQGHYYQDLPPTGDDLLFTNELQWNPAPIFHNFEVLMGAPPSDTSQASTSPPAQNLSTASLAYGPPQAPTHQQQQQQQTLPQTLPHYDQQLSMYSQAPMASSGYHNQQGPIPRLPRVHAYHQQQQAQAQAYDIVPQQQTASVDTPQYVTATMWQDALSQVTGYSGQKRRFNNDGMESSSHAKRAR